MFGKKLFIFLGKLLFCSFTFVIGIMIGSLVATLLGWQQPAMTEGVDSSFAFLFLSLQSPLVVLVLVLIARGLGGGLLPRALALSFFVWVVYALNTAVESLAFTSMTVEGALFTTVSFLVATVLCGTAVTLLFPASEQAEGLGSIAEGFFSRRPAGAWGWRIGLAAVVFVPIYLLFGSLVAHLTAQYFQENLFGLRQPSQEEIILVLLVRSVLFWLACLPIIIMWRRSNWSLFLNLGFTLFVLVGFLFMLGATYMPLAVRVPHTLEILADSFAYAGMLVLLLATGDPYRARTWKTRPIS